MPDSISEFLSTPFLVLDLPQPVHRVDDICLWNTPRTTQCVRVFLEPWRTHSWKGRRRPVPWSFVSVLSLESRLADDQGRYARGIQLRTRSPCLEFQDYNTRLDIYWWLQTCMHWYALLLHENHQTLRGTGGGVPVQAYKKLNDLNIFLFFARPMFTYFTIEKAPEKVRRATYASIAHLAEEFCWRLWYKLKSDFFFDRCIYFWYISGIEIFPKNIMKKAYKDWYFCIMIINEKIAEIQ